MLLRARDSPGATAFARPPLVTFEIVTTLAKTGLANAVGVPVVSAPLRGLPPRWPVASTGRGHPWWRASRFMVKIRLKRAGTKNTPAYRIVVADSRSPRDGRFIEEIGSYTPLQKGLDYRLKLERAEYWLSKGAQPTETVASFIRAARKQAATN